MRWVLHNCGCQVWYRSPQMRPLSADPCLQRKMHWLWILIRFVVSVEALLSRTSLIRPGWVTEGTELLLRIPEHGGRETQSPLLNLHRREERRLREAGGSPHSSLQSVHIAVKSLLETSSPPSYHPACSFQWPAPKVACCIYTQFRRFGFLENSSASGHHCQPSGALESSQNKWEGLGSRCPDIHRA